MEEIIKAQGGGAEGFWLSPDLLLVGGGDQGRKGRGRIREKFGTLFAGLWATNEQGGAEGSRDMAFPNIEMLPSLIHQPLSL